MVTIKDRLRAINYYVDLDEDSSITAPLTRRQKINILNSQLNSNKNDTGKQSSSSESINDVARNKKSSVTRKSSWGAVDEKNVSRSRSSAESRSRERRKSPQKKISKEEGRRKTTRKSTKDVENYHPCEVDDDEEPPYGPPPRTSSRQTLPNPNAATSFIAKLPKSFSTLQLQDNSSTNLFSSKNKANAKKRGDGIVSKSQVNLRDRGDASVGQKLSDPYGYQYRHIRWEELKNIIYEDDYSQYRSSNPKHVSRNKSFHSSRAKPSPEINKRIENYQRSLDNSNKIRCQSVDNLHNIRNDNLYINHIHREVVSDFINKNHISRINSNLFPSNVHNFNASLSKRKEDKNINAKKQKEKKRHKSSTSDYHSDSSSSSQSSTYSSSGCYSTCSPLSTPPSSPGSPATSVSCPALRVTPAKSFQPPKVLHVSPRKDRWVVRRADGLVVQILSEDLFLKEQKKKCWRKALLDLFREKYESALLLIAVL